MFWGSDDWAISDQVLENIIKKVNSYPDEFDLVVCKGRYINNKSKKLSRISTFFNHKFPEILDRRIFEENSFLG